MLRDWSNLWPLYLEWGEGCWASGSGQMWVARVVLENNPVGRCCERILNFCHVSFALFILGTDAVRRRENEYPCTSAAYVSVLMGLKV